jgi:hypothetical protein
MNATKSKIEDRLLGAWTLVEWSEQRPSGSKAFPLGEDAIGQIVYTADGHVAAQLARRGRRSFPSADWRDAGEEDDARAFKEYFGYFGTSSINAEQHVVTHHIDGSWFPNLEGGDQSGAKQTRGPNCRKLRRAERPALPSSQNVSPRRRCHSRPRRIRPDRRRLA